MREAAANIAAELLPLGGVAYQIMERIRALPLPDENAPGDRLLPCDVLVAPATILRKGVSLSTLMVAIQGRVGRDDIAPLDFHRPRAVADHDATIARLSAELEAAREALEPFARAGELFDHYKDGDYDLCIYKPAAGDQYMLVGADLRRARAALAKLSAKGT
jgi:hypothetical protein